MHAVNTNISDLPANNIVEDQDSLFIDNRYNYMPREGSDAVNRGSNNCNSVIVDLSNNPRIMADTIDIGAYEQFLDIPDTFAAFALHQVDSTHQLVLYNNIIINNPGHTANAHGNISGDHNMLDNTPGVFVNEVSNFSLQLQSPAIDAGDNQWVTWDLDLKDETRIACVNIVDQGAYEYSFGDFVVSIVPVEVPTDNCQGFYIDLTATAGAQHYQWSHTNEDTNAVQVSPLIPTTYSVIASNGGECTDTASVYVVPSSMMVDSLGAPASVGTTFWLSYLRNHFQAPTLTLQVSAEEACTGVVSNPSTGWSSTFSVGDHSVTTVTVPLDQAYSPVANVVGNYGILVETTDSVSLYAANYNTSSFDVTNVLPMNALSDEYVLQTYTPMMNAEFVVVATVDNTVVDITPSRALQGGHAAQQTFSVTLQAGQTYFGQSQYGGILGDLSGTVIQSHDNKPLAVFNGNVCALVPSDNSYTDHLVEQAVGVNYWGRSFAITTTESQNFDVVRVTALHNNTEVKRNGLTITTLQAFQTHEFQLSSTDGSCYIETSKPAGVYLYIAGAVQGNPQEMSDPSMVWIPPTEQKLNDLTFATFNSPGITDHYVNIVIPATSIDEVTLDGVLIGNQFTLLNGNSNLAFVRKHIDNGTHTLHCEDGFIAHCYGLGYHESYGYAAGSKAVPLKEQLFVNDILNTELPPDLKFCPYEPITFSTYTNYPCDSVTWNFGDGTPLENGDNAVHAYTEAGNYTVAATLYITSNETVFCSNLYARIRVVDGPTVTLYDTVCQGVHYQLNGFDILAEESGLITETRTVSVPGQYCDSTYILELLVLNNHFTITDTICVNHHFSSYGFDITPSETGLYEDTINAGTSSFGCDSLLILQLVVTPNTDNPPAIAGEAYPCQGGSYIYSIDSLSGLTNVVWTVPDSVLVLQQPDPYQIELMFATYADSFEIAITATGGCGDLNWSKTVYPQAYSFVQLTDTICEYETTYEGFGFSLTDVSDTNALFIHHGVATGGCDSTTVLRLVFAPPYQVSDTLTVCSNDFPYLYHDTLLADTGTYQIVLSSIHGCDSTVTLTVTAKPSHLISFDTAVCDSMIWFGITYKESGIYDTLFTNMNGCDSVVSMHLTVHYSDTVSIDSVVCRNELPILWNGTTFWETGTDTALLSTTHHCDSLVIMHLTVHELTSDTLTAVILENNLPYVLNDSLYSSPGTFTQTLTNTAGCDSTLTLVLTVLNNETSYVDTAVCENELPFVWNDSTYDASGTFTQTLVAANGADSTVYLSLTVNLLTDSTLNITLFENELPYLLNDSTYAEEGTYTQHFTNAAGCDSTLTVNLTVIHNVTADLDSVVCESDLPISWNDSLFTEAGTKVTTIPASTGADSTITMTLIVNPTTYCYVTDTACDSFTWIDSITYTQTPDVAPTYTLTNAYGCDSVIVLNLTVNHSDTTLLAATACDFYLWYGDTLTLSGTYTQTLTNATGCDSIITLQLTINATPVLSLTPDTLMDEGDTIVLHVSGADHYLWYPAEGLSDIYSDIPQASPAQSMYYHVIGYGLQSEENNLVVNGDFELGNSAFTTDYNYIASPAQHLGFGNFTISSDAYNVWPLQHQYAFNGEGLFMVVDGADYPNAVVWSQTVEVQPNTTYDFSAHVVSLCASNISTARLQFFVNGSQLGPVFNAPSTLYQWQEYHNYWNSGGNLSATITIMNQNVNGQGNDFGLDHIVFFPLEGCQTEDSVLVSVRHHLDSAVCANDLPLEWNGLMFYEADEQQVELEPVTGLDSILVMHVTVIPTTSYIFDTTIVENDLPFSYNDSTYFAAGTYLQNLTNAEGCDSILTLNLTVHPNVTIEIDSTICENELPITWNDSVFTAAGTKVTTLPASTGADSTVEMHLMVIPITYGTFDTTIVENALPVEYNDSIYAEEGTYFQHITNVSGCDSILTVNITVLYNVSSETYDTICENALPFIWNNVVFTAADTQSAVFTASNGTDSVVVMHLTVTSTTYDTVDTAIVENALPFSYNDSSYYAEGSYTQHLTNAAGCDSILTFHLTVYPNVTEEIDSTVCESELPISWNDSVFTAAGTKATTLLAHTGADSTVVMHLMVIQTTYGTFDTAVVENALPLLYNDSTYSGAGTYFQHLTNASGCDSILTLNLTVYPNVTVEVDSAVCVYDLPVTWNDSIFSEACTKTTTILASTGGDSTVVMTLIVNHPSDSTLQMTVVQNNLPITLNGYTYDSAGVYTQHLINAAGCDSVLTVVLSVLYNVTAQADSTICADDLPLTWNGVTFTQADTLTATLIAANGADSVVTMTVTVKPLSDSTLNVSITQNNLPYTLSGVSYSTGGTYSQTFTNSVGCDSIVTLNLTVYYNVTTQADTTVCSANLPFTWHGHSFTAAGNYTEMLLTSHGADSMVIYHLSVDNLNANVGNITHITCYGASTGAATATVTGGQAPLTYAWTNASGASVSSTTSISNRPAGAYTFTVTDYLGCTATATVTLNTLNGELQAGVISANQEVCDGEDIPPFTGTAASGGDNGAYQWQISTNGIDWAPAPGTANTQNYTYPSPAANNFTLRRAWISQSCGTVFSNTVEVSVWPNSSDTITAEVCQGETYQENGFDITADLTAEAGEYTFEQHHATGHCDSAVILLLTVWPQYETELEDVVCEGDGYSGNGFEVSPLETVGADVLQRTQNLQTIHGCDSIITLQLTVIDTALRIVPLTADFCDNMSMELTVETGMSDYVWSTGETAPTIMVTASGYYSVTATEGGCTATAGYRVEGCQFELVLPNAITPSDFDGVNDYFALPEFFLRDISLFEIAIFNRWGEMVYYSTDKGFRWNGEYRGEIQYQTIYNYVIEYTDTAGRPHRKTGSVTVL